MTAQQLSHKTKFPVNICEDAIAYSKGNDRIAFAYLRAIGMEISLTHKDGTACTFNEMVDYFTKGEDLWNK